MTSPVIAQAKAALNKNLAVTQSKLARTAAELERAQLQIEGWIDRAEIAERSARNITIDRDQWRGRALKAEAALASLLSPSQRETGKP